MKHKFNIEADDQWSSVISTIFSCDLLILRYIQLNNKELK